MNSAHVHVSVLFRPVTLPSAGAWMQACSNPCGGGSWLTSAQRVQIDAGLVAQRARQGQSRRDALAGPAAQASIGRELVLQFRTRQRLVRAATQVRLALLDDAAVPKADADMAGVGVGIGIGRIDLVADLGGKGLYGWIGDRGISEGIEADAAAQEAHRDAVGRRELGRIAV